MFGELIKSRSHLQYFNECKITFFLVSYSSGTNEENRKHEKTHNRYTPDHFMHSKKNRLDVSYTNFKKNILK